MSVISVSIIESEEQIISGIPKSVEISTNIVSTIFYTIDGKDPDMSSDIYISKIYLPTDRLSINLKVWATNGTDHSIIISETYQTNIINNTRLPHSATTAKAQDQVHSSFPFQTANIDPDNKYLNNAESGMNVNDPSLPTISSGYDGQGNPALFSNKEYNSENYEIIYSTRDAQGQEKPWVGTLPGNVDVDNEIPIPQYTSQFTDLFDPRAFVIYQDFDKENPEDPPQINRQFFTLENPSTARNGNAYYTAGLDAPPVNGSFLRAHYNPRDNTITHYYLDTWTNKWIISKAPHNPSGTFDGNMSNFPLSKSGAGFVFNWLPFTRRVLF